MKFRHTTSPDNGMLAERLHRQLQAPASLCTDDEVQDLVTTAQLLAPSVHPRESWRAALKERSLREFAAGSQPGSGEGSLDGQGTASVHTVEVSSPSLGRVVLADVEHIDEGRAEQVVREIQRAIQVRVDDRR